MFKQDGGPTTKVGTVFLPTPVTTRYLRMKNINGAPTTTNAVVAKMDFMGMSLKKDTSRRKQLENNYEVKKGNKH